MSIGNYLIKSRVVMLQYYIPMTTIVCTNGLQANILYKIIILLDVNIWKCMLYVDDRKLLLLVEVSSFYQTFLR